MAALFLEGGFSCWSILSNIPPSTLVHAKEDEEARQIQTIGYPSWEAGPVFVALPSAPV